MTTPATPDKPKRKAAGEPKVRSSAGLADLVAKYLASDGSFGLYDARTMIEVRRAIVPAIIPRQAIDAEKEKLRRQIVG